MNPEYPVYIPSKGRWKSRLTSKVLEKLNVPYKIVVEEQEYNNYASVIDTKKILILPFKKNKLKRKKGITVSSGVDNYGMVLKEV